MIIIHIVNFSHNSVPSLAIVHVRPNSPDNIVEGYYFHFGSVFSVCECVCVCKNVCHIDYLGNFGQISMECDHDR